MRELEHKINSSKMENKFKFKIIYYCNLLKSEEEEEEEKENITTTVLFNNKS